MLVHKIAEQLTLNQRVVGSIPTSPTIFLPFRLCQFVARHHRRAVMIVRDRVF
jgi:hypothetical protein